MVSSNPEFPAKSRTFEAHDHVLRTVDELRAFGAGGEVRITVGGKPVARFVPLNGSDDPASVAEAVEFIEQFGRTHTIADAGGAGGPGWKALRDEGRR